MFLQARQVSTPDSEASCASSPDPTAQPKPSISFERFHNVKSKHVTFAPQDKWEGPYRDPPTPLYRLSMTQLDGVDCMVDSTRCEWEKMDSLGRAVHNGPQVGGRREDMRCVL